MDLFLKIVLMAAGYVIVIIQSLLEMRESIGSSGKIKYGGWTLLSLAIIMAIVGGVQLVRDDNNNKDEKNKAKQERLMEQSANADRDYSYRRQIALLQSKLDSSKSMGEITLNGVRYLRAYDDSEKHIKRAVEADEIPLIDVISTGPKQPRLTRQNETYMYSTSLHPINKFIALNLEYRQIMVQEEDDNFAAEHISDWEACGNANLYQMGFETTTINLHSTIYINCPKCFRSYLVTEVKFQNISGKWQKIYRCIYQVGPDLVDKSLPSVNFATFDSIQDFLLHSKISTLYP